MTVLDHATSRAGSTLDLHPLTNVIGAEVRGVDLTEPLTPPLVESLQDALVTWKVLFFREQALTPARLAALGRSFGDLTLAHPIHVGHTDHPEVFVVDTQRTRTSFGHGVDEPRFAPPRRTTQGWHTDITFVANPAAASILHGVVIPPTGGDTLWTDLVAAYRDLSAPIRALLDGLQAVHVWHGYDGDALPDHDPSARKAAVHPVVRVHPVSGEKALFVNPVFTRYIVGLTDRESDGLLDLLFGQIARPQFAVRFKWETDSVAFWDNRATAHLGPVDLSNADYQRRVDRVTIGGDVPVGPDGFRSEPIVGELFTTI